MKPLPIQIASMIDGLSQTLEDWSTLLPKPSHGPMVGDWKNSMKEYIAAMYSEEEDLLVESITTGLLEAYTAWTDGTDCRFLEPVNHDQTHALMLRPQTAQRTVDWYLEFQKCLTASELSKVFGSPRERGTLIMQKAGILEIPGRSQKKVCFKEQLMAFDWGICFEPVVNQILELEGEAMLYECGRFVHPTDPRFAASPDGLILRSKIHPEMGGHLLEIKCPKSRKIGVKIPMDYYYQMQLQLEVTGVRACEYVESKFEFRELNGGTSLDSLKYYGKIAVVGVFDEATGSWNPSKYVYGPVNDLAWKPDLGLNEQTMQLNTWVCEGFHHERVLRDEAWFGTLWPKLEAFWVDVALAKEGKFTLPESSRKKKEVACEIVDSEPEVQDPDIKTVFIK